MSDDTDEVASLRKAFIMLGGSGGGFTDCHECGELLVMQWHKQYRVVMVRFSHKRGGGSQRIHRVAVVCGETCSLARMDTIRGMSCVDLGLLFSEPAASRVFAVESKMEGYREEFSTMSRLEERLKEHLNMRRRTMKASFNLRRSVLELWTKK